MQNALRKECHPEQIPWRQLTANAPVEHTCLIISKPQAKGAAVVHNLPSPDKWFTVKFF